MSSDLAKDVRWDLSDLYASIGDPKINEDLAEARRLAIGFEKAYKPALAALNGAPDPSLNLASLLKDYKAVAVLLQKLTVFAYLAFAEKTDDPRRGAFLQKIKTEATDIQSHLLFWEVGWTKLPEASAKKFLTNPSLKDEIHYLTNLRKYAPHALNEGEEKVMAALSNTGGSAFSRLFDETMNSLPFYVTVGGQRVQKTEEEVLNLMHSPDRDTRRMASDSLAEGLKGQTRLITYIYNMILAEHRTHMKLRGFKHPTEERNLANETDLAAIQGLIQSVQKAYPLAHRYYRLKRELLGLDEMLDYDRYAPLSKDSAGIPFEECRRLVLEGYYAFSEKAGQIAEEFFTRRWIDAEIRPGKQSGGFSCETIPALHPYILVNYTGSLRDVMTVAHELGHGIHQYLARQAGILESHAPLTMAETASVFGEMIIFEKILEREKDPRKRLELVCGKIDDNFATVFRQIAMTDYELRAHVAGLKEGELSSEALSGFWIGANTALYGDSVTLTDNYRHGWKYIPHFVHTPFYCYAYAFAQLFVLSLFQLYKKDQSGFVPVYFEMLSLGGSKKPEEIAGLAGINLHDPGFWQAGLKLLEDLVAQAEDLAKHRTA